MTDRLTLSPRRENETRALNYRGSDWLVTTGFNRAGDPMEVFATGPKEGSDMQHVLSDACVVISIALQHGITPAALAKSLGTTPVMGQDEPASPIGAILGVLQQEGAE